MVRIACIVNPAGRDGTVRKRWPAILELIEAEGLDCEIHWTERTGHASEIAFSLRNREDLDLVVAVGGDGTMNEVASGLRGSDMTLGIIPMGSGNDYARAHGIPLRKPALAVPLLKKGVDRRVGAIRIDGYAAPALTHYPSPEETEWDGIADEKDMVRRWAFLESDGGTTSDVSRRKTLGQGKRIRGTMKYTYLGIKSILGWEKQDAWLKVDNEVHGRKDMSGLFTAIMTETFGGGYRVAPGMCVTRESFDLILANGLSKSQMLRIMGPLKKGTHVGKWGISQQSAERFEIRNVGENDQPNNNPHNPPMWVQVDGEPCLMAPAVLQFVPNQLTVRGGPNLPNE
ncbi:MAG: diacylglycerol kinase family protein [Candidatus Thalassarchaeaceae archaeon]|nr:diacylglycerol kinase family protein [Candidatus Thalassarchaeaceae archaeon]